VVLEDQNAEAIVERGLGHRLLGGLYAGHSY
jgi:hypothetical protein